MKKIARRGGTKYGVKKSQASEENNWEKNCDYERTQKEDFSYLFRKYLDLRTSKKKKAMGRGKRQDKLREHDSPFIKGRFFSER